MATTKYFISGTSYSNLPTPKSISSGPSAPGSAVVANDTDVDINFSDGIGTAWSFSTTGMTFPDDTVQSTAYTSKYKVYTALLTRDGIGVSVEVLENTLGETLTWTDPFPGQYTATASGTPFTDGKTWISNGGFNNGGSPIIVTSQPRTGSRTSVIDYRFYNTSGVLQNFAIDRFPIEIRVYN